jgi:hypothetical protein
LWPGGTLELTFAFAGITEAFKADKFEKKINLGSLHHIVFF